MSDIILAIDLGGTRYRAGRALAGDPAAIEPLGEWPAPMTRPAFLEMVTSQLAEIGATRLGIGVPGLASGTTCRWVPNLPYLDGLDLAAALPGIAVGLGNDAQLALLAEVSAGSARGLSDAILLAIGTGIGSAVMAGGRIVAGSGGGACSFGWAAADLADPGEDRSGWLERQASGRALDAAAKAIGLAGGTALVDAARAGDAAALQALAPPMQALGTALAGAGGVDEGGAAGQSDRLC
ncbi:MAG: ROK family protein, partial [Hyphomicrobiales bacterium]